MKCHECGAEIPDTAAYCTRCGQPVQLAPAAPAALPDRPPRGAGFFGRLGLIEWLLKYREHVVLDIREQHHLSRYAVDALLVTLVCSVLYGFVIGVSVGGWQTLFDPLKLPWVLIFTLLLCLPTLYVFSAYLGSGLSLGQVAATTFSATAMVAIILLAFAPITWFLMFTAPGSHHFWVLLNVAIFIVAGGFGVGFLTRTMHYLHPAGAEQARIRRLVRWWVVLYAVVGAQMAWLLRPYFTMTEVFIRPRGGNFFVAVLRTIVEFLGGSGGR